MDLSLKDTSNYVLMEYSVRPLLESGRAALLTLRFPLGGTPSDIVKSRHGQHPRQLLSKEER